MSQKLEAKIITVIYEIRVMGHLTDQWADWFEGLSITPESNGETRITGPVPDQSALYGLLKKVRDLGLPLLSVNQIETGQANTLAGNQVHQNRSK